MQQVADQGVGAEAAGNTLMLKFDAGSAGRSPRCAALGSDDDLEDERDTPANGKRSRDDLGQIAPVSPTQQAGSACHGLGPRLPQT